MRSLIAKKVRVNTCVVSVELFVPLTIYVPLFKLIPRIQLFVRYSYLLTTVLQTTLVLYSAHNKDGQTRNFTKVWLNSYCLSPPLTCILEFNKSNQTMYLLQSKRLTFLSVKNKLTTQNGWYCQQNRKKLINTNIEHT